MQLTGSLTDPNAGSELPVAEQELLAACRSATDEDQARVAHELPVACDLDDRF